MMGTALAEKERDVLPAAAGEDSVSDYLRQIKAFPRLTPEQERALAKRCADGDFIVHLFGDMDGVIDVGDAAMIGLPLMGVIGDAHGSVGQMRVDHMHTSNYTSQAVLLKCGERPEII